MLMVLLLALLLLLLKIMMMIVKSRRIDAHRVRQAKEILYLNVGLQLCLDAIQIVHAVLKKRRISQGLAFGSSKEDECKRVRNKHTKSRKLSLLRSIFIILLFVLYKPKTVNKISILT